jgi:hypothetical protein
LDLKAGLLELELSGLVGLLVGIGEGSGLLVLQFDLRRELDFVYEKSFDHDGVIERTRNFISGSEDGLHESGLKRHPALILRHAHEDTRNDVLSHQLRTLVEAISVLV